MRALRPTTFRGLWINMLTRRGKLDATGGSVGALPERDVFSGGYVRPTRLLIGVCGAVTIPARQDPVQDRPGSYRSFRGAARFAAPDSGILHALDRGFTSFHSRSFSVRVSSVRVSKDARDDENEAHTEPPV